MFDKAMMLSNADILISVSSLDEDAINLMHVGKVSKCIKCII